MNVSTNLQIDVSGSLASDEGTLNQIAGQLDGIAGKLGQVDVSGVAALEEGAAKAAGAVQGLRDGANQVAAAGDCLLYTSRCV